ncbi:ABC transporter substrate-binding protein [Rhodoplanes serenus]|uniref:ABC transporter substrate-binding protein n=1 Tax=Rhodoplanes serenus TaxID=200615 RepID=A0A9X5ASP5_9BRAD|nr:ABC transporter substrate-binding protein [Rhodoplanes serenus]MTW16430.1 ABC transporter substrate-binding protein [Rhodoplanes serenus]
MSLMIRAGGAILAAVMAVGSALPVSLSASSPAAAGEKVTVTHWGQLMYGAPYAVAIEKGFYKELGLDIDGVLTSRGGGTTMRNVMASDLPYGEVALPAAIAAANQGIELAIVHTGVGTAGEILWVTPNASPIKSIADLAGKKVAFTSPKSVTEMLLIMVTDKHRIKVDGVAAGGIGQGVTLMQQGGVVATPIMDPVWARFEDKLKPVFWTKDELPAIVQTVGVTTRAFAKDNPDKLRKLIAARRKAVAFIYANPEEAAAIVATAYDLDKAVARRAVERLAALRYWSDGAFDQAAMDNMAKGLQIVGEISGPVDWSKLVDGSFL